MAEDKHCICTYGVKAAVAIVLLIAIWPALEIITGALVTVMTFIVGIGLMVLVFVAVVYPYWDIEKKDEKEEEKEPESVERSTSDIEKDIRDKMRGAYARMKEYLKNKE